MQSLAELTDTDVNELCTKLLYAAHSWTHGPRSAAESQIAQSGALRTRLDSALHEQPEDRWAPLAQRLHPPLLTEQDWPALATLIDQAHKDGHDVEPVLRRSIANEPLGALPAQDLRYRLATALDSPTSESTMAEQEISHRLWNAQELDRPTHHHEIPSRRVG